MEINKSKQLYSLMEGPPESMEGRLPKEVRVHKLFEELGISYQYIDHEPIMTMEGCVEADQALEATICKNLFLSNRKKSKFYLLMLVGEKQFDSKSISRQIDSPRLQFAKEEYMEEYLDITPGSVSVMGLMNDHENQVELLVDEDVFQAEYVGCHPCINTSSLRIRTKDLFEIILPAIHHDYRLVHVD